MYLASPPAAALGWLWRLPDWWMQADTLEVVALGLTVAEYAARAAARHHAAERAAIAAMEAAELPPARRHTPARTAGPPDFTAPA